MTIRLLTLGGFRVYLDGAELTALPGQPLRAALLIHLAAESPVSRAALTAMFWPESDEGAARHGLRQCLYNLSAELGADWIQKHIQELRVGEAVKCDVTEFESALRQNAPDAAARLYAGPFLDGVHLIDSKPWETWVDGKRAHLARGFRKSCREWVNGFLTAGDLPGAIRAARTWCAPDPFDDEAQHRLIELLVAAGERTDALRQYEVYQRMLEPEGLQPLEETRRLIEGVRQASPGPPQGQASLSPPAPPSADGAVFPVWRPAPEGLGHAVRAGRWPALRARRGVWLAVAGLAALTGLAAMMWWFGGGRQRSRLLSEFAPGVSSLDTTMYAVFPLQHDPTIGEPFTDTELLKQALERWQGVRVAAAFQLREGLARSPQPLTVDIAQRAAAGVGAGRFIVGVSTLAGDAVRVEVSLYDTWSREQLETRSAKVAPDLSNADSAFNDLADELLFRGAGTGMRAVLDGGTRSLAASRAMVEGSNAIFDWDLPRADSAFATAAREDPQYARAHLWSAQVGMWRRQPPAAWASPALLAWTGRQRLPEEERLLAEALHTLSNGDAGRACGLWKQLTGRNELDFAAWYGYAMCLRSDSLVLRDSTGSPSGWRFRSNVGEAAQAFQHAFLLMPSLYRALSGGNYGSVREYLHTSRRDLREGYAAPPDTTRFLAYPEWRNGGLAFVPYPKYQFALGALPDALLPDSIELAVSHERHLFRELATSWAREFPDSADAVEAVAIALELLNEPEAAVNTLHRARSLAREDGGRTRIAATEVWLRLKYAIPDDPGEVHAARLLADSLLRSHPPEQTRAGEALAGLAILLGRADRAAAYQRSPAVLGAFSTPGIAKAAESLMAYAALGGPADSLRAYEQMLAVALDRLPAAERRSARNTWLTRAATVAYPDFTFRALSAAGSRSGDWLFDAQADFLRGRATAARRALEQERLVRRRIAPSDLGLDAVLPEAALLTLLGDNRAASEWLDGPLLDLFRMPSHSFTDPMRAGGLIRALVLRARLARAMGDTVLARRWASTALELLQDPDPFLFSTREELRRILQSSNRS